MKSYCTRYEIFPVSVFIEVELNNSVFTSLASLHSWRRNVWNKTPLHQNSVAEKTMTAVKLLPVQLIQQHNWLILAWSAVKLDISPRVSNLNQKSQSLCGEFLGTHHCNPDIAGLPLSHMLAANYSGYTALRTIWEKWHLMSYLWQMMSFY